jgi:SAM-dependent methyltransferase
VTGPAAEPKREQRLVFGEVAHTYDRQRPSYPPEIVDGILSFAGLDQDNVTPVAEVGAGTGKASVLFAARGTSLLCLEPSPAMAAVARANLAPFPNAEVQETSFEDWQPAPHSYGLVFAAQSWHWISPELRYAKTHLALRPQGALAVFWNVTVRRGDESLEKHLTATYGDFMHGKWRADRVEANSWVVAEIKSSGLFAKGPPTVLREPWARTYETEDWLELLSTQSDHRMLDEDTRTQLLDRLRIAIESNGGRVEVDYLTVCYLAQALGPDSR